MKKLFICCSARKNVWKEKAKARELYTGILFRASLAFGELNNYEVIIISAKYGFISPDKIIDTYELKITKKIAKSYLDESAVGDFIGGKTYHSAVPNTTDLFPNLQVGRLVQKVRELLPVDIWEKIVKGSQYKWKVGGKLDVLYYELTSGWKTKQELYSALVEKFGENPKMMLTVQAQLHHSRLARQRKCEVQKDGDKFRLVPLP